MKLAACYICIMITCLYFYPSILSSTVMATDIALSNSIDLATTFTILVLLDLIRNPIRLLPNLMYGVLEFTVAMRRIQKLLDLQEVPQECLVQQIADDLTDFSISIDKQSFSWGVQFGEDAKRKESKNPERSQNQKTLSSANVHVNAEESMSLDFEFLENLNFNESDDDAPVMKKEKLQTVGDAITLKDIDLKVKKGEFICVIGELGSGKSSLLNAINGDLLYVSKRLIASFADQKGFNTPLDSNYELKRFQQDLIDYSLQKKGNAPVKLSGSMALVEQNAWIQNLTIRDNILHNSELDKAHYLQVLKLCELMNDLETLPAGDLTEIGQKGVNLSGG